MLVPVMVTVVVLVSRPAAWSAPAPLTKADLKVFMEDMASQLRTAAEGYGATLESIDRRLKRMSTQIRTKDRDRDLVLKDHGKRISALERR